MRAASTALQNFLATRQPWWSSDLFTLTLLSGSVVTVTSADRPITYGGTTWAAVGPMFTRTSWKMSNVPDPPDMQIQINTSGGDFALGNLKLLAHNGLLDGATVLLQRAVMSAPGDTTIGLVTLFSGRTSSIDIDGIGIKLNVKALSTILQQNMPRNIFTSGCSWSLYSSGCTLSRATWTATNTIGTGSTKSSLVVAGTWVLPSGANPTNAQLLLGTIAVTSGSGTGQRRSIVGPGVGSGAGAVQLGYPLYTLPAPGDTVTATLGCNKSQATCTNTFSNIQNYRGFDYIPPAETAY